MAVHFADFSTRTSVKRAQRQPVSVFIRQKEYEHDVAVVELDQEHHGPLTQYRKGAPVVITWGYLPGDIERFYGYVDHTAQVDSTTKTRKLKVYCVGASYRMNQAHRRSFLKLFVGSILSRVAKEHGLSLQSDPSSRYHVHIPQLGRTDWNMCVALAKDIGFTFGCRQTSLYFKRRLIDTKPGRQPTFLLNRAATATRGAVYEVTHKQGSAPFAEKRIVQVDGIDANGKPLQITDYGDCCDPDKPIFKTFLDEETPRSIHEGRELLFGLSAMNRFYVIAKAKLSGHPRVRPGMTIKFGGVSPEADGYWWVGSVEHTITPATYRMDVELGRETIQQTVYEVPVSDAGKPEVFIEPDVETVIEPSPESEYDPLDDCRPVEVLLENPLGEPVAVNDDPFLSDTRRRMRLSRPRSTRQVGCCVPDPKALPTPPVARLNGWRSRYGSVTQEAGRG